MKTGAHCWTVSIFTSRESVSTLGNCVRAAVEACRGQAFIVDVLVNGNRSLALEAAEIVLQMPATEPGSAIRVWFLPLGDKAHAWNEYVHYIWQDSTTTFFIDGYVEVNTDALSLLVEALDNSPSALGATGVPTCGRSAKKINDKMVSGGGIHGNLFALSRETMISIQQARFRLPIGLYRTDALVGAVLMFKLEPAKFSWDNRRIVVHPSSSWFVKQTPVWSRERLVGQAKRMLRQAQGHLENRAVREHLAVKKLAPHTMAPIVNDLVNEWIASQPAQARRLFWTRPLTLFAARKMRAVKNWSAAELAPELFANNASGVVLPEDPRSNVRAVG